MDTELPKKAKEKQRDMTLSEIAVFIEVMDWIYEDDKANEHKLWPETWKDYWPKRDGFNVGLSKDERTNSQGQPKRYGLFKVRDKETRKWLTYKAHIQAMQHYNKSLHPQYALDSSDPLHKDYIGAEHVGLQEISKAGRHVRHGQDCCPRNCVATTLDHLCYGSDAHNKADAGEKLNAEKPLKVHSDIQLITVALLRQGDGMEAISKRFKLRGWEVRRIADNAKLPAYLSRSEPIDRGWLRP
jgi:hypothetical protein